MSSEAAVSKTAFPSIVKDFGYSPLAPAIWRSDSGSGLQYRNLSLDNASGEVLFGRHMRSAGVFTRTSSLGAADRCFSFVFVLAGSVDLHESGADPIRLFAYDSACRYGSGKDVSWTLSHDAEIVEIGAGATGADSLGFADIAPGAWHVSRENEESYAMGEGPRRFFRYRDLGVASATGRRIHIHVVRATQSIEGGTGWHSHSMGQLFYVLRGWADLAVQHRPWVRMAAGDAMCVAPRMAHDVPGFSSDYLVLEMCIPADYDTVDSDKN
ncbi:MAG: cupin domain-containing protein [Pseudomonadota bacterium]